MYRLLNVQLVELVEIDDLNDLYVDEEGLLNDPQHFIYWEGAKQPFAGSGLIVSRSEDGDNASTKMTLEEVKSKVKFLSKFDVITHLNLGTWK
jgi:hypothetical protein